MLEYRTPSLSVILFTFPDPQTWCIPPLSPDLVVRVNGADHSEWFQAADINDTESHSGLTLVKQGNRTVVGAFDSGNKDAYFYYHTNSGSTDTCLYYHTNSLDDLPFTKGSVLS